MKQKIYVADKFESRSPVLNAIKVLCALDIYLTKPTYLTFVLNLAYK